MSNGLILLITGNKNTADLAALRAPSPNRSPILAVAPTMGVRCLTGIKPVLILITDEGRHLLQLGTETSEIGRFRETLRSTPDLKTVPKVYI